MRTLGWRTFGFAVPTLALVTALHLANDQSLGEALDGVVSGLYFTCVFLVGAIVALFGGFALEREAPEPHDLRSAARETLAGATAAALTWLALWAIWTLPLTREWRTNGAFVFAFNSGAMAVAAIVLAALRDRRTAGEFTAV